MTLRPDILSPDILKAATISLMPHTSTFTSIILHTYNVGEADKFCIVLTKEEGLITARARSVRKTTSKLCGHILPFQLLALEIHEGKSGNLITGGRLLDTTAVEHDTTYIRNIQLASHLLMGLLHEGEPVEAVFDDFHTYITNCDGTSTTIYCLRLLAQLGYLPNITEHDVYGLSPEDSSTIAACFEDEWTNAYLPSGPIEHSLLDLCQRVVNENSSRNVSLLHYAN